MIVHKQVLHYGSQSINLPACSILEVQNQHGAITMWYALDENKQEEKFKRTFVVIYTGEVIPYPMVKFIGTVLMMDFDLVYHVFEVVQTMASAVISHTVHKG